MSTNALEFITRAACPLCEEAESLLRAVVGDRTIERLDIADDRALREEFWARVPVVRIGGQVIAEGRITRDELEVALGG